MTRRDPENLHELLSLRDQGHFLSALSEDQIGELVDGAEEIRCASGHYLMRKGEQGDLALIVLQGRLVATETTDQGEERILNEIGPGELAGETELVIGGTRVVDVRALEDSRLLALSRRNFERLQERSPETWQRVTELVLRRLRRYQLSNQLSRLFGPFEPEEASVLNQLEEAVEFLTLQSGENLFQQGEPADAAYIVISGSLRVAVDAPDGSERIINEVACGETVGEMALLTGEPRSATVYAVRDSDLARIPRPDFERLVDRHPRSLMNLSRLIIERLKRRSSIEIRRETLHTSIGLVPADSSVRLDDLPRQLAAGMSTHGSVSLLTSAAVDAALDQPGIAQALDSEPSHIRLAGWLHEQEETHRYVLYQADPKWSPWTDRCTRQADHVVSFRNGDGAVDLSETETQLASRWPPGREPRRSLVLLHPIGLDRPRQTSRWLDERTVDLIQHVRRGHPDDLARLARILAGRAVGLVLGGGGARGFAHLGVLRALEELGIPVDVIGGASIGAPIAGWVAQGKSADEALNATLTSFRSLIDYTLPIASLVSGKRITESIHRGSELWDLEDLWLPYFCVSTSLTTSRVVVHRRGNLAFALRASVSIPGVLPPVSMEGELLVDGGVLNNLPVDVMRGLNPTGPVIAIDVVPPKGPRAKTDHGLSVSGWGLAFNQIAPWRKSVPVPSLTSTILRSMLVGAGQAREDMLKAGLADLYHNIHVRGVGMLDFEKVAEVAQVGYEESIEPLRQWAHSEGLLDG